jgi:hypothetical protein
MKKLSIALFFLLTAGLSAQTFTFVPDYLFLSDSLDHQMEFDCVMTNTSQDTITLYIKYDRIQVAEEWEISMCLDGNCFSPFLDSLVTTEEFLSSPLAPGDSRDFSLYVTPREVEGTGVVKVTAGNLSNPEDSIVVILTAGTGPVSVRDEQQPSAFRLLQNYPNPFNPSTEIVFEVEERSFLTLDIYAVTGEKISSLAAGEYMPGIYRQSFDASNLSNGFYIARLSSGTKSFNIKLMLVK